MKKKNIKNSKKSSLNSNNKQIPYEIFQKSFIKKIKISLIIIFIILLILIGRLYYLQIYNGNYLQQLAYSQQSINEIISPKRGTIYDSSGNALAISASVDTITINPAKITAEKKELVAKGLSEIFELNYDEVLEKVKSTNSVQTIIKKVEHNKVLELKNWMSENKITAGINIDEDFKRYYPYSTVASTLIGSTGTDNQGLSGIESAWDSILTGTSGKIVTSKDASKAEIPNSEETYIAAENGYNLTLTIDLKIQQIVEKYLKEAVENRKCAQGGSCIVMNPNNGDILAMANYPDFDLNSPFTPNSTLAKQWDKLTSEEKTNQIYSMWNNKCVTDTYEPGSVFKTITASIGLEENVVTLESKNDFLCTGAEIVSGSPIKCWRNYNPHGYQTLKEAFGNSCNPAFIQLANRIGTKTLYKYFDAFGLFEKTGVALPGEATGLFTDINKVVPTDRATMSFGQRFAITPLQMITAVCAIANDGVLMQPRIVKQITNTDTNEITTFEPVTVRQVISKKTSDEMKTLLEYDVLPNGGTGKNAAVPGYSIGGKTGTSEPPQNNKEAGYVASFIAVAPIDDPQVVALIILKDPDTSTNYYQGGQIAAPVASQILSEVLPALGISSTEQTEDTSSDNNITLPNITQKTVSEAKKQLESQGFTVISNNNGDENTLKVSEQVPKAGASLTKGSIVVIYSEENTSRTSVSVPDLSGKTASEATAALKAKNLNISITGSGYVTSQSLLKDSMVEEGTIVSVTLKESIKDAH